MAACSRLTPRRYVIGIDEVGRGPLAGPVVVTAVCIPVAFKSSKILGKVKDSKQLTQKEREAWSRYLRSEPIVKYATVAIHPKAIDRLNISNAANRAAEQALKKLSVKSKVNIKTSKIILDGGLYIGSKAAQKNYNARTTPKADERFPVVSYASIIAKVYRDRYMTRQDAKYREYGFAAHKGYGTLAHRRALRKHGRSPLHRLTFTRGYRTLSK